MGLLISHYEANPTINTVSGTLQKTFKKSFFKTFHIDSYMADYVFGDRPRLENMGEEIVVLQVMLCGDKQFLMEAIYKEDYEKFLKH